MTNEEKAMLIAEENKCRYPEDMAYEAYSDEECYTSALEMAEWKDHQFKEYLEKKKAEYISRRDDADIWSEQWAVFHALACTLHIIIIELFKEKQNERK